ncbi:PilZ domain-containing protein [Butyrivibrio sp. AE3003]|uniref:PilZ domain-containing protein n=1 Tax=Butyrivibrio sp. AE3003 TaxID=1496721 RepID=UPI0006923489|nr:PilZ domain-containing protein [Butyrivibrio sp. AE3003]
MDNRRRTKRLDLAGEILLKEIGGESFETVEITITDASRDGVGFSTNKQLTIGANYEANLTIWTKEVLHVFIQIVRASKNGDTFHYGSMFVGMPEDMKARIDVYSTIQEYNEKKWRKLIGCDFKAQCRDGTALSFFVLKLFQFFQDGIVVHGSCNFI